MMFKKAFNFIRKIFAGENKIGEALHGIIDNLPFANQILAKLFKAVGLEGEARKAELKGILTWRNGVAATVTGLIMFDILS